MLVRIGAVQVPIHHGNRPIRGGAGANRHTTGEATKPEITTVRGDMGIECETNSLVQKETTF